MNYYEGYKILKQYPFSCPKCEVYVNARENFFLAENFFKNNNYEEAINYYRLSAKMTPEKLDVDYNSYISDIYYKIGNCFFLLNDYNNARSYLEKSLNYNPENNLSKNLLNKLE
jgi:tetratricopeptide (TPR) repeat protein